MQCSSDSACRFINVGTGETRTDKSTFYFITLVDEKGQAVRCYCDAMTYGKASNLEFGDEVQPVFDLYAGSKGLTARLLDFTGPLSHA